MSEDNRIETEEFVPVKKSSSLSQFAWEFIKILVIAFVLMVGFRTFIAEPYVVSGVSMVPNFHNREYIIVSKLPQRFNALSRGDVIVFKYPKDTSQYFIKRVIGLPGEKVKIANGKVYIYNAHYPDGHELGEPYLSNQDITFGKDDLVTLGSDEFYVLGDNRLQSSDSRIWGVVPRQDIIGTAWIRLFPLNAIGKPNQAQPVL